MFLTMTMLFVSCVNTAPLISRSRSMRLPEAIDFLTSGNRIDLERLINGAVFTQETNSMVIVKNIEVYSLCEHHMLPFFGRCHIGYIAKDKVLGVSKLARFVDCFARRLQIQERLTEQIATAVLLSLIHIS